MAHFPYLAATLAPFQTLMAVEAVPHENTVTTIMEKATIDYVTVEKSVTYLDSGINSIDSLLIIQINDDSLLIGGAVTNIGKHKGSTQLVGINAPNDYNILSINILTNYHNCKSTSFIREFSHATKFDNIEIVIDTESLDVMLPPPPTSLVAIAFSPSVYASISGGFWKKHSHKQGLSCSSSLSKTSLSKRYASIVVSFAMVDRKLKVVNFRLLVLLK